MIQNPQKDRSIQILYLGIITSMFMWGISWPSGKLLSVYGKSEIIVFWRYVVVFLTMLPMLLFFKINLRIKKEGYLGLILAGVLMASYSYCFLTGLQHGMPGAGGVLVTTLNPIMAYAIGLIMNKKLPSKRESFGLAIGIVAGGVLLKIWGNIAEIFTIGNIYFLVAALLWALMSKITSKATNYGNSMAFSLFMYLVTMLSLMFFINSNETITLIKNADWVFWLNILFNGAITTTLCTSYYFYATTKLGAERASSFIFLVPASAAISSYIMVDEKIQMHTLIGGLLGMVAVFIINKKKKS